MAGNPKEGEPVSRQYRSSMLLFKKKFIELIRRGEKTQTIRFWKHCRMKAGQRSYIPGVGYIAIISVEPVKLARLTNDDALLDGFPTAELLRKEIRTLYTAEARKELTPYKICFSVYPPEEQQWIKTERQKQKREQKHKKNRNTQQEEFVNQTLGKLREMSEQKPE